MIPVSQDVLDVHAKVRQAMARSHAPYSNLHVCSGLKIVGQSEPVIGVNVENASFGGTICAERSAVVSSISQYGASVAFEFIVVISDSDKGPIPPCGICLQFLKEFVGDEFPVYLGGTDGVHAKYLFKELLPISFDADSFS